MQVKRIKIFLASSIEELKETRNELARFVLGINNWMIDQRIYIQMELCEEMDNAVPYIRKQNEYNAFIKSADFIFCIFYNKVGSYTKEEFDTALEQFKRTGSPKIFTYFYQMPENCLSGEVRNMMDELDKKHNHFYSIYNNIDMLKLAILQQVTMFFDKLLILEDSQVYIDYYQCMTITNIPAFSKNKDLLNKKAELNSLGERYQNLIQLFEKDKTNKKLAEQVSGLAQKIDLVTREVSTIEQNTWKYLMDMQWKLWDGNLSEVQKKIYRCLESGNIADADVYLSEMSQSIGSMLEVGKRGIQNVINCYKQKIYILKMQEETEQKVKEIRKCYESGYEWAIQEPCDCKFILEYAIFLADQNDPLADDIYKKLEWIYSSPDKVVSNKEYFEMYLNVATYNRSQGRTEHVEELYYQCLCLLNEMDKETSDFSKNKRAIIILNMGNFYHQKNRLVEAEEKYREFLECMAPQKELLETYEENYIRNIAVTYRNLAVLEMQKEGDKEQIKKDLDQSFEWMQCLYKKNKYKYGGDMANLYISFGNYYDSFIQTEQWRKAEEYYRKNIELCEELYKRNPSKYGEQLMHAKNNFGAYCDKHGQLKRAEQYLSETQDLAEELHKQNSEKYDRVSEYLNYGIILRKNGDRRAIDHFKSCLDIIEKASEEKKLEYEDTLADIYYNIALCPIEAGDERVIWMKKSIQIVEKNYQKNQKRYRVNLASKYNDLALLYDELLEEHELANNFFDKTAFLVKEVGNNIDLERDGLTLVRIYNNLALSYYLSKSRDCALEYLQKSIDITNALEQFDINKYRPFLIDFYNNLAEAYDKISKYKVIPCYLKALGLVQGLKEAGDELYNVKLAETYYCLIQFCISNDEGDGGSILDYLEQYMQVLQKLESINSDKHNEYLIRGYYTIGQAYEKQTNNSLMKEYYDKCWGLLKDVDELATPEIDYTDIYNDLSLYYQSMEKIEEVNDELSGKIQKRNFFEKFKNYVKK